MNISLVIPSRNNLKYVIFAYESIRRNIGYGPEIILLDDASSDGTWEWMKEVNIEDNNTKIYRNNGPDRVGHTVLYDKGAELSSNEIFGIFHADMIATPNYIKNMLKHLKRGTVVSATRIEPPLHPPGPEKIVMDFGIEPEEFRESDFLKYVLETEKTFADKTTEGIFAPWMMYKEDFFAIGGHDKRLFSPMELEDSDLFNRFKIKGYSLIQSRDAFVYHLTCRGSRFKDGVKIVQKIPLAEGNVWNRSQDSSEYTELRNIKFREWWRKWHSDVLHDANMLPIVYPRYDIGIKILNANYQFLQFFEPWSDTIYIEDKTLIESYISKEQPTTKFNLKNKIKGFDEECNTDILITFDAIKFNPNTHISLFKQIPLIIQDSGQIGNMEFDIFEFNINSLSTYNDCLVHSDNKWVLSKLLI